MSTYRDELDTTIVSLTNEIKVVEEAAREKIGQLQSSLRELSEALDLTEAELGRAYAVIRDLTTRPKHLRDF